mmetsp:Transcript_15225/g.30837  ORF Transcript_15225/g.30837 Transcript_15225/m.30837 type:complete len:588 (-) Transcript_15225:464-2227(-)
MADVLEDDQGRLEGVHPVDVEEEDGQEDNNLEEGDGEDGEALNELVPQDNKSQVPSGSSREDTPDPLVLRLKRSNAKLRKQLKEMTRLMDVDIRRKAMKKGKRVGLDVDRSLDPDALAERLTNYEKKLKVYRRENQKLKKKLELSEPDAVAKLENLIHEQELKIEEIINENKTMKKERRQLQKKLEALNEDSTGFPDQLRRLGEEVRLYKEKCKKYVKRCEDQDRSSRKQREYLGKIEDKMRRLKAKLKKKDGSASGLPAVGQVNDKKKKTIEKLEKELADAKASLTKEKEKARRIRRMNDRQIEKQSNEIKKLEAQLKGKPVDSKREAELLSKLKEKETEIRLQATRIRELQKVLPKGTVAPLPSKQKPRKKSTTQKKQPGKPSKRNAKGVRNENRKRGDSSSNSRSPAGAWKKKTRADRTVARKEATKTKGTDEEDGLLIPEADDDDLGDDFDQDFANDQKNSDVDANKAAEAAETAAAEPGVAAASRKVADKAVAETKSAGPGTSVEEKAADEAKDHVFESKVDGKAEVDALKDAATEGENEGYDDDPFQEGKDAQTIPGADPLSKKAHVLPTKEETAILTGIS